MSELTGGLELPSVLPIFPLAGVLLLARGRLPLNIFEPRYLAMTRDALGGERLIGMVQPTDPRVVGDNPPVYPTGCAGRITSFSETDDGRFLIGLTGVSRFRIREELPLLRGYRRVVPDWREFTRDLESEEQSGFDRDRLLRDLDSDGLSVRAERKAGAARGRRPRRTGAPVDGDHRDGGAEPSKRRRRTASLTGGPHGRHIGNRPAAARDPCLPADQGAIALRPRSPGADQRGGGASLSDPRRHPDHAGRRGAAAAGRRTPG